MVPNRNAGGHVQAASRPHAQPRVEDQLICHATAVAVQARPRSPRFSPAKYVRPDGNFSPPRDVIPQRDVDSRTAPQARRGGVMAPAQGAMAAPASHASRAPTTTGRPSAGASAPPFLPSAQQNAAMYNQSAGVSSTAAESAHMLSRSRGVPEAAPPSALQLHAAGPDLDASRRPNAAAVSSSPLAASIQPSHQHHALPAPQRSSGVTGGSGSCNIHNNAAAAGAALLAEIMAAPLAPAPLPGAPNRPAAALAAGPTGPAAADRTTATTTTAAAATQQAAHRGGSAWGGVGAAQVGGRGGGAWAGGRETWVLGGGPAGLGVLDSFIGGGAGGGVEDPEEEARRARRRHRKRVARIVVDHWKQFAGERLRALAAKRHRQRRLLTAGLVAWQAEAAAARARMRQAAVYDLKRAFLGLGRCLQAWRQAVRRLATLRLLQERFMVARLLRQTRACLRAWRGRCYHAAEKRRMQLQAWYYWCFSTLTRALRKWHAWALIRRAKASRATWASAAHAAALGRKAFTAWRRHRAHLQWKAVATAAAGAFRRIWVLRAAVRGWRGATRECALTRRAGCVALAALAEGLQRQQAAAAFREWQAYAVERRRRHQRGRYALAYMRRWRQLVCMWALRQHSARQRHLRRCELALRPVGRRLRLSVWWHRWLGVVALLQGQRTSELRAAVLQRACWAAWRAAVEAAATKRELLRLATQRVQRVVAAAALSTWRCRTAQWRTKAAAWATAVAWHRRRALGRLLSGWRREATRRAAKAAAGEAAEEHWRRRVLGRAVRWWRRYAWRQYMKVFGAERYLAHLAAAMLRGWLRHTRYKARKELLRRRAVRHRYLALLHSGLGAFRCAVERRRSKQADWADLARLHSLHVARAVMSAWARSFVPAAAAKRAVGRRADLHWASGRLRRALAGWAKQAARLSAKHSRERQASGYASLQLLRRTLGAWAAAPALQAQRREAKAARVEAAAAALAAAAARRLLTAWREVHGDLVMKRFQAARAHGLWRDRTLRYAMTSWALYLAHRRTRRLHDARARAAWRQRLWRAVLEALAAAAAARRGKRRLQAVAEEHWRSGLLRRGLAALRWYGRYRAAKAHGYTAARAQFLRGLQREGAVAWLQVGLARRQRRIEVLAAAQARNLARELALAEPFARRWLHTVRCRRRQRILAMTTVTSSTTTSNSLVAAVNATAVQPPFPPYRASAVASVATSSSHQLLSAVTSGAMAVATAALPACGGGGATVTAAAAARAAATAARRPPPRTPPLLLTPPPPLQELTLQPPKDPQQHQQQHQQQPYPLLHHSQLALRHEQHRYQPTVPAAIPLQGRDRAGRLHGPTATTAAAAAAAAAAAPTPAAAVGAGIVTPWGPGAGVGGGGGRGGSTSQRPPAMRARPQPRCPDFLVRRPATVGSPAVGGGGGAGGPAYAGGATARQDVRTADARQYVSSLPPGEYALAPNAPASSMQAAPTAPITAAAVTATTLKGHGFGAHASYHPPADGMQPGGLVGATTGIREAASPSAGITIHRSGPHPPDILRLPTRDGGRLSDVSWSVSKAGPDYEGFGGESDAVAASGAPRTHRDIGTANGALRPNARVTVTAPCHHPAMCLSLGTTASAAATSAAASAVAGAAAAAAALSPTAGYPLHQPHLAEKQEEALHAQQPQQQQLPLLLQHAGAAGQVGSRQPSQLPSSSPLSLPLPPPPYEQELAALESTLSYCKSLKDALKQLEGGPEVGRGRKHPGAAPEAGAAGAGGTEVMHVGYVRVGEEGEEGLEEQQRRQQQQQAAEVRAALAAMRPAVEQAAARLRQMRGLG